MADKTDKTEAVTVGKVPPRKGVKVGKPPKIATGFLRSKVAYPSVSGSVQGSGGNFYSPELSTDFLELPQSLDEKRNYFRFFYGADPFVGQALDLQTELPLSKVRLGMPKAKNRDIAQRSLNFCAKWAKKIGLLHRLIEIVHDYNLLGEVFIFCEDASEDMPQDITQEIFRVLQEDGSVAEEWQDRQDANERAVKWLKRNYHGWSAIRVLPPEQIHMESYPFTDQKLIELVPDSKTKDIIHKAEAGDPQAQRIVDSMPSMVVDSIRKGENIPLNTDPESGSFVFYMARKKSQYEPRGHSVLERCILPGTPITVNRQGLVVNIPVEQVDVNTDLLLTGKGRFRKASKGTRNVDEEVVGITIHSISLRDPICFTKDHKIIRINAEGQEEEVLAGDIKAGDKVRESHIRTHDRKVPLRFDLADHWENSMCRASPGGLAYPEFLPAPGAFAWGHAVAPHTVSFKMTEDLCYILGAWVAKGKVKLPTYSSPAQYVTEWWIDKKHSHCVLKLKEALQNVFGEESIEIEDSGAHTTLKLPDALLARWIHEHFQYGKSKILPDWMFGVREKYLLALLGGILDSSGRVETIGKKLMELHLHDAILTSQLYLVCKRLNLSVDRWKSRKSSRKVKKVVGGKPIGGRAKFPKAHPRVSRVRDKTYSYGAFTTYVLRTHSPITMARMSSFSVCGQVPRSPTFRATKRRSDLGTSRRMTVGQHIPLIKWNGSTIRVRSIPLM